MRQNNISTRRPDVEEMRLPQMCDTLPAQVLEVLRSHSGVMQLPAGTRIAQRKMFQNKQMLFLIDGSWSLEDEGGSRQLIEGNTSRARDPVFDEGQGDAICVSETTSKVLRIPVQLLNMVSRQTAGRQSQLDATNQQLEDSIVKDFEQALHKGKIKLPPMPDVAVRIARQIDDPDSTSETVARIVQMDPSVVARLIQVVNSPFFGTSSRIDNARDAITRLGRVETRDLVTSFVLKGIFRSKSPLLKQRMQDLWQHSTHIAAICHALAKRVKGMDPASALLLGLVHDIGIIPILALAEDNEHLATDPALLQNVIDRLRAEYSAAVLRKWDFGEEFAKAALDAEDWQRDRQTDTDYGDILVLAQLYAIKAAGDTDAAPEPEQVPAFTKLAQRTNDGSHALDVLNEASQEIAEVQSMIS